MQDSKKFAYFLPNVFTALNMACGYAGVMFAIRGNFYLASMFIFLGAVFDTVDGRVARLTGTESAFGEQFDSLSDLLSFGLAPALIFYHRFLVDTGRIGMIISFVFVLCAALRLARFNANIDSFKSDFFQGLPVPGAAISIVGFVLLSTEFKALFEYRYVGEAYLLFYSFLMISSIPFFSFKSSDWLRAHKRQLLLAICFIIVTLFIWEELIILSWMSLYVLSSLVYYIINRKKLKGIFVSNDEQ